MNLFDQYFHAMKAHKISVRFQEGHGVTFLYFE